MTRHRRIIATISTLLLTCALAAAGPHAADAKEYPASLLAATSDTASWSGEIAAGASVLPEACTPDVCDFVPIDVRLPDKTWQQRPGGILAAIRVPNIQDINLNLHLYGPGCLPSACRPIASATQLLSSDAVWVPNPGNGRYTVVVAPSPAASQPLDAGIAGPIHYEGFVKFQRGLTVQRTELNKGTDYTRTFIAFGLTDERPAVELLPDLVPTTPRNFDLAWVARGAEVPSSCLPTETLGLHEDDPASSDRPTRCLRFDQGEYNFGDGPFQLNVYEIEPGVYDVYQRIYASDGSVRQIGPLGDVEFNDAHGHFHYQGFQHVTLHRIQADGSLTFVKEKPDKGICMVDIEISGLRETTKRHAPAGYPYVTEGSCIAFTHEDPNDPTFPGGKPYFEMGITTGWADIYPATLWEQYIDITDVSENGDYALVVRQDVPGRITEKTTSNNTAMGCVRITDTTAHDIPCPRGEQ
jgi:hypothetical protein